MKDYVKSLKGGISMSRTTEFMMANVIESTKRGTEGAEVVMENLERIGLVAMQGQDESRHLVVGGIVAKHALGETSLEEFVKGLERAVPEGARSQRIQDVLEAANDVLHHGATRERLETLGKAQHAMQDGQPGPMADLAAEAAVLKHEQGGAFDFAAFREERGVNAHLRVDNYMPQMAAGKPYSYAFEDNESSVMNHDVSGMREELMAKMKVEPDWHKSLDGPSM